MAADASPAHLSRPVDGRSRAVPCPGTRYTEVAGVPVVWEPRRRALHELSPAAAALWGVLDGRPLDDIVASVGRSDADRRGALVEAVRRLRAVGLVEDAPDAPVPARADAPDPDAPERGPAEGSSAVTLLAEALVLDDGVMVVLAPRSDVGGAADLVRIDVEEGRLVGSGARVLGLVLVGASDGTARREGPVRALGALAAAMEDPDLDALALLAETVPCLAVAVRDADRPDHLAGVVRAGLSVDAG